MLTLWFHLWKILDNVVYFMDTAGQWLPGDGGNNKRHKETFVGDEIFITLIVTMMSQVYTHIKLIRLFIWNTCSALYFDYISVKCQQEEICKETKTGQAKMSDWNTRLLFFLRISRLYDFFILRFLKTTIWLCQAWAAASRVFLASWGSSGVVHGLSSCSTQA